MSEEVLIRTEGHVGWISLNRPEALHALTTNICRKMTEALLAWRHDDSVRIVMIDHHEGRGFCAGGDIRALHESIAGDGQAAREFFETEYKLNVLIQSYPKPYVAFMDGVTMGGGVGVSVHGAVRVVTENTQFAMPETGIGLFPDVGGGWFLPRLPGRIGAFMGLTGARLKAADCLYAGIGTHYAPAVLLGPVKAQIIDAANARDPRAGLDAALGEYCEDAGAAPLKNPRGKIDRAFDGRSVEEIVAKLGQDQEWGVAQARIVAGKSPLSLKVALRQIETGRNLKTFADVMRMEHRIARRIAFGHDFSEGVRALVIEKDNSPHWSPSRLEDVTPEMLDAVFAPLPAGEELELIP